MYHAMYHGARLHGRSEQSPLPQGSAVATHPLAEQLGHFDPDMLHWAPRLFVQRLSALAQAARMQQQWALAELTEALALALPAAIRRGDAADYARSVLALLPDALVDEAAPNRPLTAAAALQAIRAQLALRWPEAG
jgi:hypothetical protein